MSNSWQYSALKTISRIVCVLPYPWVLSLGNQMGKIYYRIAGRQRKRAISQIQDCLGLPAKVAEETIIRLFGNLGKTFFEVMYMPTLTPEKIEKYITIENRHYLDEALTHGRGVVLLTAHIGNWEWLGATLAMTGFPLTSVIKRQPNDEHTRILNEYREMVGIEIFARGTSEILGAARALKQGKILGLLADQDAGPNGVFIDFLGKMASTPTGSAVFAKKFKSPVVPAFIVRKPEGGHKVIIHEPLYYRDTGKSDEDLYQFSKETNNAIEQTIRKYPDEWLWFQKRWNTSPTQQRNGEQA
ncbi:lysophospholipid acyltransferase family protein [Pelosinus sp. sgz500959]|uniref:lysophospholipid acyltransferase family protein n=1 Tax=Pelosinus sp. sgz500959 TaxID=3242472 RepID=UPI003671379B